MQIFNKGLRRIDASVSIKPKCSVDLEEAEALKLLGMYPFELVRTPQAKEVSCLRSENEALRKEIEELKAPKVIQEELPEVLVAEEEVAKPVEVKARKKTSKKKR